MFALLFIELIALNKVDETALSSVRRDHIVEYWLYMHAHNINVYRLHYLSLFHFISFHFAYAKVFASFSFSFFVFAPISRITILIIYFLHQCIVFTHCNTNTYSYIAIQNLEIRQIYIFKWQSFCVLFVIICSLPFSFVFFLSLCMGVR